MKTVVVGLGIQGKKRQAIARDDVVATVDPAVAGADYMRIEDVPLGAYDAALVCTPDAAKLPLLTYLLEHGKHVLVEKPVFADTPRDIERLIALSKARKAACYTAYNHRFEPHVVRMKALIESGALGPIYLLRMFYGNGTARDVKNSPWRDCGAGVLPDLGSHLLDTVDFLIGRPAGRFEVWSCNAFENRAPDHFLCGLRGKPAVELEMTLLSWRNHFVCDVFAEKGSAHIESLCKWGPSSFTRRWRKLPSGRPDEESVVLVEPDPTWALEYKHFQSLCETGGTNLHNDLWINDALGSLARTAVGTPA